MRKKSEVEKNYNKFNKMPEPRVVSDVSKDTTREDDARHYRSYLNEVAQRALGAKGSNG